MISAYDINTTCLLVLMEITEDCRSAGIGSWDFLLLGDAFFFSLSTMLCGTQTLSSISQTSPHSVILCAPWTTLAFGRVNVT